MAADWYTSPTGTGGGTSPTDRGEAITVSRKMGTGDTLHFAPGTYNLDKTKSESTTAGSGIYFRLPTASSGTSVSNLTFIGESDNPEDVRLVGTPGDKMRIFYCATGGHTVRNMLISGGYTDYQGGGVCMASDFMGKHEQAFTISNCVVENCSAAYRGASCGGVWRDCVIRNNTVRNTTDTPYVGSGEGSGGGVFNATLYNCVITNNTAGFCGGGIAGGRAPKGYSNAIICPTTAYNCLIGWNRAQYGAGAGVTTSFTGRAYCQLINCTVVSNKASQLGGGAFLCTVTNSILRWNDVPRGGKNAYDATTAAGGGVAFCDVFDSILDGNTCSQSGAGATRSSLTGCRIVNNTAATQYGGGTYGCPLVKGCLLSGNKATFGGAGFNGYFENCVITNNEATVYDGGATYNATSRNCIVVGNTARFFAHCRGAHYGDLVYGNKNRNNQGASGIGAESGNDNEPLPVVNCTVWNNFNGNANVSRASLTNSIVWSVANMDTHSAVNSFWRSGTVANQTGCISGTDKDPKFVGDGINPAATVEVAKSAPWTAYAIRVGSPCRDMGLTLPGQATEKDALGNPRVKYDGVDMGALECIQSLGMCIIFR